MCAEALRRPALDQLVELVATSTGFSPQAIAVEAIARLARHGSGGSPEALLARVEAGDPAAFSTLLHCVLVNETHFFRHERHFQFLADSFLPHRLNHGPAQEPLRAWSAGCATGEEAYSLAACLHAVSSQLGCTAPVSVLGTDLVAENLERAREATYGAWSVRPATPLLYPVLEPAASGPRRVLARVRGLVCFAQHNLLEAPPAGGFDVVFCRNVLIYFSPFALRRVVSHLAASLAPGGLLALGTMDITAPIPGLEPVGPSELNLFVRPEAPPPRPRPSAPAPAAPPPPALNRAAPAPAPPEPPGADPVATHLEAMARIEQGELQTAEQLLTALLRTAPDYLPGLLECALLLARRGDLGRACALASDLLRRAEACAPDELVPGPERLLPTYYRVSATAILERVRPK